ncbi:hypothetical protein D3C72_1640250 [compost metagenome]
MLPVAAALDWDASAGEVLAAVLGPTAGDFRPSGRAGIGGGGPSAAILGLETQPSGRAGIGGEAVAAVLAAAAVVDAVVAGSAPSLSLI